MTAADRIFRHHLHAPAVRYPARRSRMALWWIAALSACALLLLGVWLATGMPVPRPVWPASLALALWVVVTCGALHWWWRNPVAVLCWDGIRWELQTVAQEHVLCADVEILMDFQSVLLVQARVLGSRRVLWYLLEEKADPSSWADLRRAVYCRAHADPLLSGGSAH